MDCSSLDGSAIVMDSPDVSFIRMELLDTSDSSVEVLRVVKKPGGAPVTNTSLNTTGISDSDGSFLVIDSSVEIIDEVDGRSSAPKDDSV